MADSDNPSHNPWDQDSLSRSTSASASASTSTTPPRFGSPSPPDSDPYDAYHEPVLASSSTSYPPPPPNPFSAPRNPQSKRRAPPPRSVATSSYESVLGGLSSPGLDGPLAKMKDKKGNVILGVAVVDFNHLVGPIVEFSYPESLTRSLAKDDDLTKLLPFLALPDGAHLSEEDYSYFHCIYSPKNDPKAFTETADDDSEDGLPTGQTIFGISCNRQLASEDLLNRPADVTRSTVQKAVVVLASRPVFGPIRDKLGVVTRAFFAQRDFTQTDLLPQFYASLEHGLMGKENEGGMYIGTSLRDLLHKFRHRTLTLVKMMMLQKRIMFYGYPVERLCTLQYSLLSLMPGLLMNLGDAGDPSLDFRSSSARRPSSLRTSDRNSLLRYMGLPLHTFGKEAFFQPYLPLQQIAMLTAGSWLVGTTNSIVTQQRDCQWDLLINIEQETFQFHDPQVEKLVALTPSDRAWMDVVVRAVEETWNAADPTRPHGMVYKGSDDDLRARFEEYICAALATLKYVDFISSGQNGDTSSLGPAGVPAAEPTAFLQPFSEPWLNAFRETSGCKLWDKSTDPLLFDICEPKHPCEGKANTVSDIGIRLAEGLHDLKLDQQLAPAREVVGNALAAGSSTLFRAFEGVRGEVASRLREREVAAKAAAELQARSTDPKEAWSNDVTSSPSAPGKGLAAAVPDFRAAIGGLGSFFGSRVASLSSSSPASPKPGLRPMSLASQAQPASAMEASPNSSPKKGGGAVRLSYGAGAGMDSPTSSPKKAGLRPMNLAASATVGSPKGSGRSPSPSSPGQSS